MDATIGKGYSMGLTSTTVFCPECHQGVAVPIDGDRADIGGVREHLRSHYGLDAFVDFQVADMLAHALGFGPAVSAGDYLTVSARGGVVGAGNPHQPNSSSAGYGGHGGATTHIEYLPGGGSRTTIGHTTYF